MKLWDPSLHPNKNRTPDPCVSLPMTLLFDPGGAV